MAGAKRRTVRIKEAQCRCCGCTDASACPEGCSWVLVDREQGRGICSSCDPLIQEAIEFTQRRVRRKQAARR
jgi:hypothetical protein